MGYREDVVLCIAAPGMAGFRLAINKMDPTEKAAVEKLLSEADAHWENPDEDHLWHFNQVKTTAQDFEWLMEALQTQVYTPNWYALFLGEDGGEESQGEWFDNPFNVRISRVMDYDTGGCVAHGQVVKNLVNATNQRYWPVNIPATPTATTPVVNNHTCPQCKNPACNKQEKSCWKCGCPISS